MGVFETSAVRDEFERIIHLDDASLDLGRAALLIAAETYPTLDIERYLRILDSLGRDARRRALEARDPASRLQSLVSYMHRDAGFSGDNDTYYDPRNSFLSEVIERRKGIPVTLAIVYMEIGRRAGVPLFGVGFPSHFLIGAPLDWLGRATRPSDCIYVDPFRPETFMTADDCRTFYAGMHGSAAQFRTSFLKPVGKRQILVRMLSTLKLIYAQAEQYEDAIGAIDRILLIAPNATREYRDRGALYMQLELFGAALDDFERYLRDDPASPERTTIENAIVALRERIAMLH